MVKQPAKPKTVERYRFKGGPVDGEILPFVYPARPVVLLDLGRARYDYRDGVYWFVAKQAPAAVAPLADPGPVAPERPSKPAETEQGGLFS